MPNIQPELTVNEPGDKYEKEAERVADAVVRMSEPESTEEPEGDAPSDQIERMCPRCRRRHRQGKPLNCEECEQELKRSADGPGASAVQGDVEQAAAVTDRPGTPLSDDMRSFFEIRMGGDFGDVRIHTGVQADRAARSINAVAYTVGSDIVCRSGACDHSTQGGKRLLAHELTHVVHQRGTGPAGMIPDRGGENGPMSRIQRQVGPGSGGIDPMDTPRVYPEDTKEEKKAKKNAQKMSKCKIPSGCPGGFCTPYTNVDYAKQKRAEKKGWLLAGISQAVNSKVVPVWRDYLMGGAPKKDFSSKFSDEFKNSKTTKGWTTGPRKPNMKSAIENALARRSVKKKTTFKVKKLIPSFIKSLGDSKEGMNFNIPGEVPGNIAGDIGSDQKACPVGAKPSSLRDDRTAKGTVEVEPTKSGNLKVTPSVKYEVQDTVDLCPGNCGRDIELIATVPMSQFEATGISGDVPYTVTFPAPLAPFVVSRGVKGGGSKSGGSNGGSDAGTSSNSDAGTDKTDTGTDADNGA